MNVWTCIMLICGVTAFEKYDYYNVGTVLFSRSDLQKKYWSKREVQLLEARRYFQDLLPPPNFIATQNNGIHALFDYFKNSYTAMKKEATDPETDNILTAAISDVFGGYLKLWALPITKFSYYGGIANQDDALKLHDLYDEIKTYLNTNGKGWRSPNPTLLNTISIKVAPPRLQNARDADNSCDTLAYFEKTKSGYSIPLPNIEWEKGGETMFLPLKSDFLVPLNKPIHPDPLLKYYSTAKNCMDDQDAALFDENFQSWLNTHVLPHLNDETLYPALGSVLSLVNKTTNLCDTVVDMYSEKLPFFTRLLGMPINMCSKKVIILLVIMILEVVWCIPALCYLLCTKYKRRNKYNNVYMIINKKDKMCPPQTSCDTAYESRRCASGIGIASSKSEEIMYPSPEDICIEKGLSHVYGKKVREANRERREYLKQLMNAKRHQNVKISNTKKSGPNPSLPLQQGTSECSSVKYDDCSKSEEMEQHESQALQYNNSLTFPCTPEQLEKSETVTIFKSSIGQSVENKIDEILKTEKDTQIFLPATNSKGNQSIVEKSSKTTMVSPDVKLAKSTKEKIHKKYVTVADGNPYLEITIENRPRERETIAFNIARSPRHVDRVKPSKIPKPNFNSSESQTHRAEYYKNVKKEKKPPSAKHKSCIPQLKQKVQDDLSLNVKKTGLNETKLNTSI